MRGETRPRRTVTGTLNMPEGNTQATARVLIPDWHGDRAPSDAEHASALAERDAALIAWRTAGEHYEAAHPAPPVTWAAWREGRTWASERETARIAETIRLERARERVRRNACLATRSEATIARVRAGDVYPTPPVEEGVSRTQTEEQS